MRARSTVRLIALVATVLCAAGAWGAGIAPALAQPGTSTSSSSVSSPAASTSSAGSATSSATTSTTSTSKTKTQTLVSAGQAVAGRASALDAIVTPTPSGGTVAFTSDGAALSGCSTVALSDGSASCSATLAAGKHKIVARYSGQPPAWAGSSGQKSVTVAAAPVPSGIVGSLGSCTTTKGALVAVDFKNWSGPIVRGCDPKPTTGIKLLTTAGFTTTGTQHDGPAFICRIGHPQFSSGTQYPTPAQDACVQTPPADAYWSYWLAAKGKNTWTYSPYGAYSDKPTDGEVQAWTFGATDIAGTNGQPAFTPNQIRAGLPAGSAVPAQAQGAAQARRVAQLHSAQVRAAALSGGSADLAKGVDYLINGKNPNGDPQLVGGHYYDQYGIGFADWGLTMDGVLALAAVGTPAADAAAGKIVAFINARGKDALGNDIDNYTSIGTDDAGGGSIGKEALVAEVTGYDPRAFGGHDLIKALDGLVCTKAITNVCDAKGNYRNATSTFSQALGIIAQLRAGDTAGAKEPIAYLLGLQHDSGAFPSVFPPSAKDSETDSTGMAAMALALIPGPTARAALAKALTWLAGRQESDGGFPGASGNSVNSAAISVQALRLDAQAYAAQIDKAQAFLAGEQNADGGFNVAVGTEDYGSDIRASTQAVGGVAATPFGSLLDNLTAKDDAAQAASYLVDQLADGNHYETTFDGTAYPDQGLTADGLFALAAAGGHDQTVAAIESYLEGQVDAYADPAGGIGGPYSGSLAKLALVAEVTGKDPHAFGPDDVDLLSLLEAGVCTAAIDGDSSPCTAEGDFHNAYSEISQALGVLALQASAVDADHLTIDSPAVVRLHQLQCADGGFTSELIGAGDTCTSDVDATGFAVQALAAVQGTDTWLGAAQHYLEGKQLDTGLYPGTAGDNANSTSLAAQGLQSLVDALTSPTADPPQPKTIAPIATWQSSLIGLHTLAVSGGGFGVNATGAADVRASTQAVVAAAQRTLLAQSGAVVLSLPRLADPTDSGPSSGSSGGGSGGSGESGSGSGGARPDGSATAAADDLADTGVATQLELLVAALLMVVGLALAYAGRRRVAAVIGRHRAAHR